MVVAERYYPEGGGGELATHLIIGLLSKRFEITVITGTAQPERQPGVRYIYEPHLAHKAKPALWLALSKLARQRRFTELLRQSDILYIPRFSYPVIPEAKRLGKRVVVHLHGYAPLSYTSVVLAPYEKHRRRTPLDDISIECNKTPWHCAAALALWWLPRLARRWLRQSDVVICTSRRHAEIIKNGAPELADKITIAHNPPPPLNPDGRQAAEIPTFLYLGGGDPIKGFKTILETAKRLGNGGKKARLYLTNHYSHSNIKKLRDLERRYKTLEIKTLGYIPRHEIAQLYKKAWALLFPSTWEEPLPYAVVESATAGVIPVATPVGGVPELLSDTPAAEYMAPPSAVPAKAEKIAEMTPSEVEKLGASIKTAVLEKLKNADAELAAAFA